MARSGATEEESICAHLLGVLDNLCGATRWNSAACPVVEGDGRLCAQADDAAIVIWHITID